MAVLIQKAKAIAKKIVKEIEQRIEILREKLNGILGTYPVYEGLIYTEEEEECIEKTAEIVGEFFEESPGDCLLDEDFESRCEAIEDFGARLVEYYGLDGVEIVITDDEEVFPGQDQKYTRGKAVYAEGVVYINSNFVRVEDGQILEQIVSTIIHELRHFMQFQIITMQNTYGVPYNRRHAWRSNFLNYEDGRYDVEAYRKQPIEVDARNFANRVWRKAYGKKIQ